VTLDVTYSRKSKADLDSIWDYTCQRWSRDQANTYLAGLRSALDLLAEQPQLARLRQEFSPALRVHPYRSHLVIFAVDETELHVIRVVHGRSDWEAALR
jgi:toxin ParE1/3/4